MELVFYLFSAEHQTAVLSKKAISNFVNMCKKNSKGTAFVTNLSFISFSSL